MQIDVVYKYYELFSHGVFYLVILATMVVKITPTKADDKKLDSIFKKIHKTAMFLPTIGVNPVTKDMIKKTGEE